MTEQTMTPVTPEWDLPDRLRKTLRHADVGVQEMAEYLEVSRNTVSSWINGHHRPPATALKLWAMRCGVPYEWVAHGITPEQPDGPVSAGSPGIPAGLSGQQPNGGYETVENDITRLRKRIPLNPARQLAIVSAVAA